jgi:hypothetical protein
VFSDNWFDIHGREPVQVSVPKQGQIEGMSAAELREQLVIEQYNPGKAR